MEYLEDVSLQKKHQVFYLAVILLRMVVTQVDPKQQQRFSNLGYFGLPCSVMQTCLLEAVTNAKGAGTSQGDMSYLKMVF